LLKKLAKASADPHAIEASESAHIVK